MDQAGHIKKSAVIRRSILINSHKTSVSLENDFWFGLREIADHEHISIPKLVERIDHSRDTSNLSSAIRIFVFNHFRCAGHEDRDTQSHLQANAT
jgi:predicted DNA-binding ribbon-helix-helix protein